MSDVLGGGLDDLFGGDDDDDGSAGGGMSGGVESIIIHGGGADDDEEDDVDDDEGGVVKSKVSTVDPEPEKKCQSKDLIRQNCIRPRGSSQMKDPFLPNRRECCSHKSL